VIECVTDSNVLNYVLADLKMTR